MAGSNPVGQGSSPWGRAFANGLIVQQEDAGVASRPRSIVKRADAIPGGSTLAKQSRGPTATTLGSHPGNDGSIPSGTTLMETASPDTPTGRAARLKPECLQVRLLLWVLTTQTAR